MGFFDEMLAGGLAGAGKGMVDMAATNEREDAKKEMLAMQLAQQKAIADQRSEDLRWRYGNAEGDSVQGIARGAGSGTRSGGAGGGGSFFENMMRSAKTPEEQSAVIREAGMRMGPDAAAAVSEYYGKPIQETVDVNASHAIPDSQQGPRMEPEMVTRGKSYDKDKGAQALNRLIAMADPGKYDDYTKGETGAAKLDAARNAAKGMAPLEAAETIQSLTGSGDQRKIDAQVEMNDARIAAKKAAGGGKGAASASTIFKTITDEAGNVIGVKRDGTKVDLGIKSDSFNKQVAALVTKMNDNEGGGFRKLPEDQKRAKATERLLGGAPAAKAAPATDRASQFKVIR